MIKLIIILAILGLIFLYIFIQTPNALSKSRGDYTLARIKYRLGLFSFIFMCSILIIEYLVIFFLFIPTTNILTSTISINLYYYFLLSISLILFSNLSFVWRFISYEPTWEDYLNETKDFIHLRFPKFILKISFKKIAHIINISFTIIACLNSIGIHFYTIYESNIYYLVSITFISITNLLDCK